MGAYQSESGARRWWPDHTSVCSAISRASSTSMLNRPQILGAPVNQRRLRSSHRMGAVCCRVEANLLNPTADDPRIPAHSEVRPPVNAAWQ
jgi:hypothetical protein